MISLEGSDLDMFASLVKCTGHGLVSGPHYGILWAKIGGNSCECKCWIYHGLFLAQWTKYSSGFISWNVVVSRHA